MTATTTLADRLERHNENAQDKLGQARKHLANAANDPNATLGRITDAANDVAREWGRVEIYSQAAAITRHGITSTEQNLTEWATDILLRGADDTWSGRGNDNARSKFDGIRDAITIVLAEVNR